jgi:antitoxin YefM
MKARKARTQLIRDAALATGKPCIACGADGRLDKASLDMYSNPVHVREALVMPRQATYTYVRENLARLLEEVEENRDVVIINRRGHEDVALVPAGELESLVETAHLLRSPKNAERLLTALRRALARKGKAQTVAELRAQLGLK